MNSTSGKDTVLSHMYMQSLNFLHAAFLKKYVEVEMYGSQDMLQDGFRSRC